MRTGQAKALLILNEQETYIDGNPEAGVKCAFGLLGKVLAQQPGNSITGHRENQHRPVQSLWPADI